MQLSRSISAVAAFGVLLLAACSDTTAPESVASTNSVSARINGVEFKADSTRSGANQVDAGDFLFYASSGDSTYTIDFDLEGIGKTGTYALGTDGSVGGGNIRIRHNSTNQRWHTPFTGTAGTLTITDIRDSRISGTFSFVATPQAGTGAVGNLTVSEGRFDVPIRFGGPLKPLPANAISKIRTTINGVDLKPARLEAYMPLSSPANFAINSTGENVSLLMFLADITGPGTYQFDKTKTRWMYVATSLPGDNKVSQEWIGYLAGVTGSVTITTLTNDRIVGTFAATIQPSSGGNQQPLNVNGEFDMGRIAKNFP